MRAFCLCVRAPCLLLSRGSFAANSWLAASDNTKMEESESWSRPLVAIEGYGDVGLYV